MMARLLEEIQTCVCAPGTCVLCVCLVSQATEQQLCTGGN